jgi:hypothetical protein
MSEETEQKKEQRASYWLGDLLAVIHGDGGHYQEKHGTEQAAQDALGKIFRERKELDRVQWELEELYASLEKIRKEGQTRRRQVDALAGNVTESEEDTTMKGEKNTQKSGEGYPHECIYGPKSGGNPTQGGGINRPTKGKG